MSGRFAKRAGGIAVTLEPSELAVLERISSVVGSIGANRSDPAARRLDPEVHPDDEVASAEFSRLAVGEVAQGRTQDSARFSEGLQLVASGDVLPIADAEAWVRTLGTARITLVARTGRDFSDDSFAAADRSDADMLLVDYLGLLQEELLEVLLAELPVGGEPR